MSYPPQHPSSHAFESRQSQLARHVEDYKQSLRQSLSEQNFYPYSNPYDMPTPPADAPPPMTPDNGSTSSTMSVSVSGHGPRPRCQRGPRFARMVLDTSTSYATDDGTGTGPSDSEAESEISPTTTMRVHDWWSAVGLTRGGTPAPAPATEPLRAQEAQTSGAVATDAGPRARNLPAGVEYPTLPPVTWGAAHIPSAPAASAPRMPAPGAQFGRVVSPRRPAPSSLLERDISPRRTVAFDQFPPFVESQYRQEKEIEREREEEESSRLLMNMPNPPSPDGILRFPADLGAEFERAYQTYKAVLLRKDVGIALELFRALEAVRRSEVERSSCYARFEALAEGFGAQNTVRHDSLRWEAELDDDPKRPGSPELRQAVEYGFSR